MMKSNRQDLNLLADYIVKGMDVHINKTYPFTAYKEAYEKISKEGALGKTVFII